MRSLASKARKRQFFLSPMQQVPIELEKWLFRLSPSDMTELNQVLSRQLEQNRSRRLTTEARKSYQKH